MQRSVGALHGGVAGDQVADTAHGLDHAGPELAAQVVDMHLYRVALDFAPPAVELLFQLGARQHTAG